MDQYRSFYEAWLKQRIYLLLGWHQAYLITEEELGKAADSDLFIYLLFFFIGTNVLTEKKIYKYSLPLTQRWCGCCGGLLGCNSWTSITRDRNSSSRRFSGKHEQLSYAWNRVSLQTIFSKLNYSVIYLPDIKLEFSICTGNGSHDSIHSKRFNFFPSTFRADNKRKEMQVYEFFWYLI